ncbi:hypothetical protein J6590_017950 [Homalodisca vitripennis]|nr:hypothetical protein J6590_017950 [Homalodisca vitripennis]
MVVWLEGGPRARDVNGLNCVGAMTCLLPGGPANIDPLLASFYTCVGACLPLTFPGPPYRDLFVSIGCLESCLGQVV